MSKILARLTVKLTRVTHAYGGHRGRETLHFTFEGGQPRRARAARSFVAPQDVPIFEGDEAWFEVEQVASRPWSYWRAVRRVDPPNA
ncbi:hypothetical protein [Caulobacter endophyticus]|uniref:hypothetical protein n=1 Tax=Caulobacter endophyticus TaxID=2172652 RepID=UPI00240F21D9|nr:hypothetical protein [Caulobacter endophyticus]MDG2531027.1 hypothetical protein [Caulobacter endophyticus]